MWSAQFPLALELLEGVGSPHGEFEFVSNKNKNMNF